MYKRDRALKQQALRQKQQMLASCQMRIADGSLSLSDSTEPLDIKPDPALLMSMASSYNYAVNGVITTSPHSSNVPSPVMSDTSAADLRLSHTAVTTYLPSNPTSQGVHSGAHTIYQTVQNNDFNNFHQPYFPSVPQPELPLIPQLLMDLKASMADENEIKHKLLSFIHTEFGHEDLNASNYTSKLLRLLCRLSDQLLFLMVEWARTSVFFKHLKVSLFTGLQRGDLRLSGSIIRKSRFIFTKEWRIIRQMSDCLNHSNEGIFQVNILMQGRIKDSWKGVHVYKRCWFRFVDFISMILNII